MEDARPEQGCPVLLGVSPKMAGIYGPFIKKIQVILLSTKGAREPKGAY